MTGDHWDFPELLVLGQFLGSAALMMVLVIQIAAEIKFSHELDALFHPKPRFILVPGSLLQHAASTPPFTLEDPDLAGRESRDSQAIAAAAQHDPSVHSLPWEPVNATKSGSSWGI